MGTNNAPQPLENQPWLWLASLFGPVLLGAIWGASGLAAITSLGLAGAVLAQLLVVSVVADLKFRRIPNWATYTAFGWALLINLVGHLMPEHASWLGAVGIRESLAGGLGLLAIMFVIFSISGGGAGDVKLAACIGGLLGWELALNAILYSFVFAAAGMLCIAIWARGPVFVTNAFLRGVGHLLLPTAIPPLDASQRTMLAQKFPLAPFFAAGTLLAIYWRES